MKKFYMIAVCLLLATLIQAQKRELSLNLEKEKEYTQAQVTKATVIQEMQGQDIRTEMTMTAKTVFLVKEITETSYEMEVQYKSISMTMSIAGNMISFDSEKNNTKDPLSVMMSNLKNKPFYVRMTKKGKVEEVKGTEALFENMFQNVSKIDDAQKEQIKKQMMQAYGGDALKGSIETGTAIFPETAVAIGDKWASESQVQAGMSMTIATNYTLKDYTDEFYTITGTSAVQTDKFAVTESNGVPTSYDAKGTMTSTIKVDTKTGWIIESTLVQDLKGKMQMLASGQVLDLPMVTKTKTTIKNN
jgi:hypothetical protein